MTILVVDDERNIADGIAYTLGEELDTDAEVYVCYGSQQAKEFAEKHFIDIIVCDINMPKQNGLSLCSDLLQSYPQMKTVFLTGYSDFSYAYEAMKLPDVSYVLKLENDDVLIRTVKEKIASIDEQHRKNAELICQRQLNRELSRQLGDLQLKHALTGEEKEYGDTVFLLICPAGETDGLTGIVRNAFNGSVAVLADEQYLLASIRSDESISVISERAKRLQQDLYERTGTYNTFILDPPCAQSADSRLQRLLKKSKKNGNALYFLDATEPDLPIDGGDDAVIASVAAYIDAHLGEDLSLALLASTVYYNPAYLSRKFKAVMGSNLHAYILARRMELARKLLVETDGFVQEIAAKCGFSNPTQFGMTFAKVNGCSPGAYRRNNPKHN